MCAPLKALGQRPTNDTTENRQLYKNNSKVFIILRTLNIIISLFYFATFYACAKLQIDYIIIEDTADANQPISTGRSLLHFRWNYCDKSPVNDKVDRVHIK